MFLYWKQPEQGSLPLGLSMNIQVRYIYEVDRLTIRTNTKEKKYEGEEVIQNMRKRWKAQEKMCNSAASGFFINFFWRCP